MFHIIKNIVVTTCVISCICLVMFLLQSPSFTVSDIPKRIVIVLGFIYLLLVRRKENLVLGIVTCVFYLFDHVYAMLVYSTQESVESLMHPVFQLVCYNGYFNLGVILRRIPIIIIPLLLVSYFTERAKQYFFRTVQN